MLRVIFDRSIFHGLKFQQFRNSSLSTHVASRKIQPLYTPIFFDETVNYFLKDPSNFKDQWGYLIGLNQSKWFQSLGVIIQRELDNNMIGRKYYFCLRSEIEAIIKNVNAVLHEKIQRENFFSTPAEILRENEIKEFGRETRKSLRQSSPHQEYDFEELFNKQVESYIENGLMKRYPNSQNFLKTWHSSRSKCRFTEQYVRALFSTIFLPVSNHNLKIDKNDTADAEQLAYLEWADVLVSDDTKFMKKGFDLLYGKSTKQFFSSSEFLRRL